MCCPQAPCQEARSSSNIPAAVPKGCIISRLPTSPDELPSPAGWVSVAESRSSRGVPMPLQARIVTAARCTCSFPSRSTYSAPVTRPFDPSCSRFTLAPVTSVTPRSTATGQYVLSTLAFAPSEQPQRHVARCVQGLSRPYFCVAIAFGPGHQCQPRSLWALATRRPMRPSGTGPVASRRQHVVGIRVASLVVVRPASLCEAHRVETFFGQPLRGHGARRAGADDQHIWRLLSHSWQPQSFL